MAGGKETPRQKMIGMMYLVLTALLALNVTKEVLNAFVTVNNGLEKTNVNFSNKNEVTYAAFEKALLNDEKKVRKYYDRAITAGKLSKELTLYIENLKKELMKEVEGEDTLSNLKYMHVKDNFDIPTHVLIGDDPEHATGKVVELKDKINKYRENLLALVDPKERPNMRIGLTTEDVYSIEDEKTITWENNAFYHAPIAAVITVLSKLQNDVKNGESDIINTLFKQIDVSSFKFDTLSARVVANSNYVLIGDEYRAEVFVAAFSKTANPQVWLAKDGTVDSVNNKIIGGIDSTSVQVSKGIGIYTVKPSSEGEQKWCGLIRVKNPVDNQYISYSFKSSFISAKPAAVVSPTKMNVLYIGVDNPVEISCPGVDVGNLKPSMSGGSMSGGKGKYIVRVTKGPEATISVSASFGGSNKSMGTFKFRVKPVPDPVCNFGGKRASDANPGIGKSQLLAAQGVIAEMVNFDFDLKFQVLSFDLSMTVGGVEVSERSNGNMISPNQKQILSKSKTGSKVYIENVKVKGPDGSVRTIAGVSLKVIG